MNPEFNTYQHILHSLKQKISHARLLAAMTVNSELLYVYLEISNSILQQQKVEGWGTKVIDRLATDQKIALPDFKDFPVRNLKIYEGIAETYSDFKIMQPLVV